MRGQHLSVSLSPVPTRINIQWRSKQSLKKGTESTLYIKLKCSNWNIVGISTRVYVPSLAYRSDVVSEGNTVVSSLSGRGCKESWNAVISLICLTGLLCLHLAVITWSHVLACPDSILHTNSNACESFLFCFLDLLCCLGLEVCTLHSDPDLNLWCLVGITMCKTQ